MGERELGYLNLGTSAFVLALIALGQAVSNMKMTATDAAWPWTTHSIYLGAFFLIGFAYLNRRTLSSLIATGVTGIMLLTGIVQISELGLSSGITSNLVLVFLGIEIVGIFIAFFDFFSNKKADDVNHYMIIAPFALISVWSIVRFYLHFSGAVGFTTLQLVLQGLVLSWSILGCIVTFGSATKQINKWKIGGISLEHIAFLVIVCTSIVFLASWMTAGLGLALV